MRISEVIANLQRLQELHGDLRVVTNQPDYVGRKYYELDERHAVSIEEGYQRDDMKGHHTSNAGYWRDAGEASHIEDDVVQRPLVVIG